MTQTSHTTHSRSAVQSSGWRPLSSAVTNHRTRKAPTMTSERVLTTTRRGFRFTWHGGDYIDISGPGTGGPFEVINTSRPDGSRPEFNLSNFELELADVDYNELRSSAREHNRNRPAGGWSPTSPIGG